jgi:RNA recognition motif-containing protein
LSFSTNSTLSINSTIMADVEMTGAEAQNGAAPEPMEQQSNGETGDIASNDIYKQCIAKKVAPELAKEVVALLETVGLTNEEFDERAIEQLSSFPLDQGKYIIKELKDSQLYGVQNKPQYLMSLMRNLKDRVRQLGPQQALGLPLIPGPPIAKISEIINRTGYQLEVTVGQRKFHAPGNLGVPEPKHGHEVYIGQIPRDVFEDELIPLFESIGTIFDLRLMMDPIFGKNRGYAFLLFCEKDRANEAAKKYDGFEIQSGKQLKVNVSVANKRLFIGNIPKSKSREEILEELKKHSELEGVMDVIIYSSPDMPENRKNRGFCFVDFQDHKTASDAKRRLEHGKIRPFNGDLVVDWAEQQDEPDDETMATVKVLYVKNLKESVTEEKLTELFSPFGEIDKIKKLRDYAFIHYKERDPAVNAMDSLKGTMIEGIEVDISLAKPQSENKSKKKVTTKRGGMGFGAPRGFGAGPQGPQRGGRGGFAGPGGFKPYQQGGYEGGYHGSAYGGGAYPSQPANYYDPYAYYGQPDPYATGYGAPAGGYGYGGAGAGAFRGGFNPRGARGGNFGGKRRGDQMGGPNAKRGQ